MGREAKKSTVNYDLRRGSKVVHKGKTDDTEKRAKEPTQQGKRFTISTNSGIQHLRAKNQTTILMNKGHRYKRPRQHKKS